MLKAQIPCNYTHVITGSHGAGLWLIEHRSQFPPPFSKLTQQKTLHMRITHAWQIKRLMKDWIHISHIASCGAGGVCFSLLPSPSLLHSLCKCNRRITRDKALQSRDMMPPFCADRGIQIYLTWCNEQNEQRWVIYLSHWLLGNMTPQGVPVRMLRLREILSINTVTRRLRNTPVLSLLPFIYRLWFACFLAP